MTTLLRPFAAALLLGVVGCGSTATDSTPAPARGPESTTNSSTTTPAKDAVPPPPPITDPKPGEVNPSEEPKKSDSAPALEAPKADATPLSEKEIAEVKTLPADEQAAALAQKLCPVSGHGLGSMGTPVKQMVEGRTFYLCCSGCEGKVKADPKAVIAKLDKP